MSQTPPPTALAAQVARLWTSTTQGPKSLILLATPGRDPGELREIAQRLGVRYLRLDLGQTVTPEQHGSLTDKEPRIVAIFGFDRLGMGERDSLVRLLGQGARTLSILICPVAADKEVAIRRAWRELREYNRMHEDRAKRLVGEVGA